MDGRAPTRPSRRVTAAVRRPPAASRRNSAPREPADSGAVTVEAALALCTLSVFLAVAVGAIAAVGASIRCIDGARELARLAARGEPDRGRAVAAALAPTGARIELVQDGDTVVAEVSAELLRPLPLRIGGRAVAALEPTALAPEARVPDTLDQDTPDPDALDPDTLDPDTFVTGAPHPGAHGFGAATSAMATP